MAIGGPKARAVLSLLVLEAGRVVSVARLIEGIWGEDPPNGVQASLQVHISNLRKVLGDGLLVTRAPGYVLDVAPGQVDHLRFEAAVRAARIQRAGGDAAGARAALASALADWRGSPLADVRDAPFVTSAVPWLEEQRAAAVDEQIELSISLGDHRTMIADVEAALAATPHRERLWGHLMLALYRSGRQADALAAFQRARSTLLDDLGIEPGPDLRRLEAAILAQSDSLDAWPTTVAVDPPAGAENADLAATVSVITRGNARLVHADGTEIALVRLTSLGRHPACDVVLNDPLVSRRHAEIRPALGGHLFIDLGSANGSLVNGAAVVQHLLQPHDRVTIGTFELEYLADL